MLIEKYRIEFDDAANKVNKLKLSKREDTRILYKINYKYKFVMFIFCEISINVGFFPLFVL